VKVLSLVAPDKPLPSSATPNTRDEACWKRYLEDPLTVRSATPRWVTEVLKHQAIAFQRAASIRTPALVLQGGDDTATAPDASRRFADRCHGDYKEYAGCLHEVLNEPEEDRRRVLADLTTWLRARVPGPAAPASPAVP
jgi:alpha-beta hydrolase superfamily lysophospholipase